MKIALLGAESTGKTRLAGELAARLRGQGKLVAVVSEVLREWCRQSGRTPRPEEQMSIACEQERRVDEAAQGHDIVIADTTALMVTIYSGMLFEDGELYRFAVARQRHYDHTLVTGLDLPWMPDGLQREGPQVREDVDSLVRKALAHAGVGFRVVYGTGEHRLANTLAAIAAAGGTPAFETAERQWKWLCDKCSDPQCELRLFTSRAQAAPT